MSQTTASLPLPTTIGLDLGSRRVHWHRLDPNGEVLGHGSVPTTREALRRLLTTVPQRVVLETCGACRWVAALGRELGHEVVVANPRRFHLISQSESKSDRRDAKLLAEVGQVRPSLLHPVRLRGEETQRVRVLLAARRHLIEQRTGQVNFIRGQMRTLGLPLASSSVGAFTKKFRERIPGEYREALWPLLDEIDDLNGRIKTFDQAIERISREQHPETEVLRQIPGVGPILALTYIVTLESHEHFEDPRLVGAFVGLVPKTYASSEKNPQLRITKCGDRELRNLLVSAATWILTWGKDSNLRRFGERIRARQDQTSRGKARIAVARKLAVLLHRLWRTGEAYEPLHGSNEVNVA